MKWEYSGRWIEEHGGTKYQDVSITRSFYCRSVKDEWFSCVFCVEVDGSGCPKNGNVKSVRINMGRCMCQAVSNYRSAHCQTYFGILV